MRTKQQFNYEDTLKTVRSFNVIPSALRLTIIAILDYTICKFKCQICISNIDTIAKRARLSKRVVWAHIKALIAIGVINYEVMGVKAFCEKHKANIKKISAHRLITVITIIDYKDPFWSGKITTTRLTTLRAIVAGYDLSKFIGPPCCYKLNLFTVQFNAH